jgi:hypothetical protein
LTSPPAGAATAAELGCSTLTVAGWWAIAGPALTTFDGVVKVGAFKSTFFPKD